VNPLRGNQFNEVPTFALICLGVAALLLLSPIIRSAKIGVTSLELTIIDRNPEKLAPNHRHHQYSYYAIDTIGVLHILITQEYLWRKQVLREISFRIQSMNKGKEEEIWSEWLDFTNLTFLMLLLRSQASLRYIQV